MKQFTQNRFLVLLVAVLLAANLAVMLYFFLFRKHEHRAVSDHPVSDFIQKELGLNDSQQHRFLRIRDQHRAESKPVLDDIRNMKDTLFNMLRDPGTKDADAQSLVDRIGQRETQWEWMIFQHFRSVRAICDSSQLPKFDTLMHHVVMRGPWSHKKNPPK